MRIPQAIGLAWKRAWQDTLGIAGISRLSWTMLTVWFVLASGPILLSYLEGGWVTAMPELKYFLYSVVTVGSVFAAILLSQFWYAPFKILRDRGDPVAIPIDPKIWKNVRVYTLDEAACLWIGAPPHSPIMNPDARAAFYELRSAMLAGRLRYRTGVARTMNRILGETEVPKGSQALTAIDLRRYADSIGTVPAFLKSVEVPIERAPESEEERDEGSESRMAGVG